MSGLSTRSLRKNANPEQIGLLDPILAELGLSDSPIDPGGGLPIGPGGDPPKAPGGDTETETETNPDTETETETETEISAPARPGAACGFEACDAPAAPGKKLCRKHGREYAQAMSREREQERRAREAATREEGEFTPLDEVVEGLRKGGAANSR